MIQRVHPVDVFASPRLAASQAGSGTAFLFPYDGLVGFGSRTLGAHGFASADPQWVRDTPAAHSTYFVTTLNPTGPGSIDEAFNSDGRLISFSQLPSPGIIDFAGGDLFISRSYLTIDGTTAPSWGVTFKNISKLKMEPAGPPGGVYPVHDIIVKNIRAYGVGDELAPWPWQFSSADDLWELDGSSSNNVGWTGGNVHSIVLDHLTNMGSGNGNCEMYGAVEDVTVSNCLWLLASQGQHSSTNDIDDWRRRITMVNNVYGWISERQPRQRYGQDQWDFVGNVAYGWGWVEQGGAGWNPQIDSRFGAANGNVEYNRYIYVEPDADIPATVEFLASQTGDDIRISTNGANTLPTRDPNDILDQYLIIRDHSTTGISGGYNGNNGLYRVRQVIVPNDVYELQKTMISANSWSPTPSAAPAPFPTPAEAVNIRLNGPLEDAPQNAIREDGSFNGDWYVENNIWSAESLASGTFTNRLNLVRSANPYIRQSMVNVADSVDYAVARAANSDIRSVGVDFPNADEIRLKNIIATAAGQ